MASRLRAFQFLCKVQQRWQGQPHLLGDPLHLFLHRSRSRLPHLLQQGQQRLHFVTACLAVQETGGPLLADHHDLEQVTQLSKEVAHRIEHAMELDQSLLLFAGRRLSRAAHWFLAHRRLVLLLLLDQPPPLLFVLHQPKEARLHLCCQMQEMPHIALMGLERLGRAQRLSNGLAAITDGPGADYSLRLQIP